MTLRPVRTSVQTWFGWWALAGLLASCSSGSGGTAGAGGGSGGDASGNGGSLATGGQTGTGGANGGNAGSHANGGNAGSTASGGSGGGQAVGPSGATVAQAGVTLAIPSSALATTTMITVAPTTPPSGYTLASDTYQFGPSGTTFAQPVAVTIPLTSVVPGIHLFWSNASGGFDDVGGTVTGSSLTANVTHFSVGFCAVPKSSGTGGTGGSSASGGASGAGGKAGAGGAAGSSAGADGSSSTGTGASSGSGTGGSGTGAGGSGTGGGAGTTGGGGSSGTAGTTGSGGSSGTAGTTGSAGSSGTGGTTGSAGASGAIDAGLSGDAAASLCKTFGLNLPFASVSNVDAGVAPDSTAYTGGTIASARYYLNSVTHYGAGSYAGSRQSQYTFDTTAKTIVIGQFVPNAGGSQYVGMTYTQLNANTLRVTVVCNSGTMPSGTFDMYYTVSGSQITLTVAGSNDVLVL